MSSETIPFHGGIARPVRLGALKNSEAWQKAFERKAKDHRFYEIVEETLVPQFEHHYFILEDETGEIRAVQPVFFVRQNLVEGIPALKGTVDFVRRKFPRFLTMRILMVGNAAGDGHIGNCREGDEPWVADALARTLPVFARAGKASLIVFKDFPAKYRDSLGGLKANHFTRVPSMPMTRLALTFRDFEDYFSRLSKATRKDLRRKFRRAEKQAPLELEITNNVAPFVDEMHPLYLEVHERSPMRFETLTKDYFCELCARMPDKTRFFLWRQNGLLVAFSLTIVHDGVIYDDYLGLDYRVALDLHLYFLTFRDIITWALQNEVRDYRSSPLNYEPKLHLDCELMPLDLYVMHTSKFLNAFFRRILPLLEPTRHDRVLHRFPNAHELQ